MTPERTAESHLSNKKQFYHLKFNFIRYYSLTFSRLTETLAIGYAQSRPKVGN